MLRITIPARPSIDAWDEENEVFVTIPGTKEYHLQLEHSLVSLRKWESKWCKPFLSDKPMSEEETIDYIRCMTLTQNIPDEAYSNITNEIIEKVSEYIAAPMTATWFSKEEVNKANREIVTAEVIYYWMIALTIPPEYQKWHLNSLLTLIKVCNAKNNPKKSKGKAATASQYAALNAARRKKFNSKG